MTDDYIWPLPSKISQSDSRWIRFLPIRELNDPCRREVWKDLLRIQRLVCVENNQLQFIWQALVKHRPGSCKLSFVFLQRHEKKAFYSTVASLWGEQKQTNEQLFNKEGMLKTARDTYSKKQPSILMSHSRQFGAKLMWATRSGNILKVYLDIWTNGQQLVATHGEQSLNQRWINIILLMLICYCDSQWHVLDVWCQ